MNFLTEAVTHIAHVEDNIFDKGSKGFSMVIETLQALKEMLSGNSTKKIDLAKKWDGSPSIIAGHDPADGRFFVASKGIKNKVPKVYKSNADIDAMVKNTALAEKYKLALAFLPESFVNKDVILHGDVLFTKKDLKTRTINKQKYTTFHPNTIVYAVPNESDLAKEIRSKKLGIAWHNKLVGESLETLETETSRQSVIEAIESVKNDAVFSPSGFYEDLSGTVTLTKEETEHVDSKLSEIVELYNSIDRKALDFIESNQTCSSVLKKSVNSRITEGTFVGDPEEFYEFFSGNMNKHFTKLANQRVTPRGKNAVYLKADVIRNNLDRGNMVKIMAMYNKINDVKNTLLERINKIEEMDTFIQTENGYEVVKNEGLVATDILNKGVVKLVDRLEFSKANFSPDVIKGFER